MKLSSIQYIKILIISTSIGCSTPKTIYIKKKYLALNTMSQRFDLGVAVWRPFVLNFGLSEPVYDLSFYNEKNDLIWRLKAKSKKTPMTYIKYGKVMESLCMQEFPANNNAPDSLIQGSKYIVEFESNKGKYRKEFLYQLSEVYITDSDKIK